MKRYLLLLPCLLQMAVLPAFAQNLRNNPGSNHGNKFEQLGTILPDANGFRAASGAPGSAYWQQQADYRIDARLDEKALRLHGEEVITYYNNSPDVLTYVWLQLDENQHHPNAESNNFDGSEKSLPLTKGMLDGLEFRKNLEGYGVNLLYVGDTLGKAWKYTVNNTMMRIDLPVALKSKQKIAFRIKWNYKIPERMKIGGRGGYEKFGNDSNCTFTITQWYPRMCVYSDYQGWNNKQFTGRGEFSLTFGNFEVKMEVPADHVIAATGSCLNYDRVLTAAQLGRWKQAQESKEPVEVVTQVEAKEREKNPDQSKTKIWHYKATNVRDFAWGSSRKFVWDAMPVQVGSKKVMAMSYYPKEAYGLYRKYSTKVVAHTIRTYSKHTIDYPYPVAISVEAANGMEYPMICFNFGRTEDDGTYSERTKYGMIGVIIHEVGHNFFPMIINSDERNCTWMDEGLNTFVQFLAGQAFDNNYPSGRGPAYKIVDYMKLPKNQLEPIMTNSENINQFGPNAYAKPATALNILRETVMGRELFDYSFKEYCRRWAFKHPAPADFFRTMEDASGVDLDWFWRGWFYDTDPVDISLDSVLAFQVKEGKELQVTEEQVKIRKPQRNDDEYISLSSRRNKESGMAFLIDQDTSLRDFYYYYKAPKDTATVRIIKRNEDLTPLSAEEMKKYEYKYYYELQLSNKGGLVMPVIVGWDYADGTTETEYISAYIWRKDENKVTKTFAKEKQVVSIRIDPYRETADIDESNNTWPKSLQPSRFDLYKGKVVQRRMTNNADNPMRGQGPRGK